MCVLVLLLSHYTVSHLCCIVLLYYSLFLIFYLLSFFTVFLSPVAQTNIILIKGRCGTVKSFFSWFCLALCVGGSLSTGVVAGIAACVFIVLLLVLVILGTCVAVLCYGYRRPNSKLGLFMIEVSLHVCTCWCDDDGSSRNTTNVIFEFPVSASCFA